MEFYPHSFYDQETDKVAQALLGARLLRVLPDGSRLIGRIVETEAYLGPDDGASHARRGRTPRTEVMFGPVGHAYVYFTYGMHWMLNVVARRNLAAGAVLIRAVEPLEGVEIMRLHRNGRPDRELTNGPAKLAQALNVTGAQNRLDLCDPAGPLLIAQALPGWDHQVSAGPRIGIQYAPEPWRSRPLRFWIKDSQFVSRKG